MKFIDWFAGIGGFRLGLERAGMKCVGSCEIEKKPREYYEKNFDGPPTFADIQDIKPGTIPHADLWCGGFPCQGLSVAGKRGGLDDPRSGLWWEWANLVEQCRPRWIFIENVPGFLSCSKGSDFGFAVAALEYIGYGLSWRILDAQFFGLAQRRRRVFIVGYLGNQCPSEILFEPEGRQGNTPKGGKAGSDIAHSLDGCTGGVSAKENQQTLISYPLAFNGTTDHQDESQQSYIVGAVSSKWAKGTGGPGDRVPIVSAFNWQTGGDVRYNIGDKPSALHAGQTPAICAPSDSDGMREATGLPGRLDVSMWCNCADSARYRALGNAVAVPVIKWIGKRIMKAINDTHRKAE